MRHDGYAIRAIARELGVDPKTVRHVLHPKPRPKRVRPSKLDPFRPLIRKLVLTDELTAVRVHEEIHAVGYRGGYTVLKAYIRTFRPKPIKRPHLRFETKPGCQGQVDLSPYTVLLGETPTPVVCFSFVLGFSRWQFIRFVLHADVRSVCHSHALGFDAAGGVPSEILYDRMKQVVLESHRDGVIFHPLFEQLVQHYGFRAVPLAPGYKEGKGKVENPFGYVENNFLGGRTFHDLDDLNGQAARWLEQTAWVRIHRTTQEQPVARLAQERGALLPLPDKRFDAALVLPRQVGDDFCIPWETNRYSVPPHYAGHTAIVRALEGRIEIEVAQQVVATHVLRTTRHQRHVAPEHEAEFRKTSTSRHVLAEQFRRLGAGADAFAAGLVEARGGAAGYHMSQILKLADRIGVGRVAEAMRHATRYGAFDYQAITRITLGKSPRTVRGSTTQPGPAAAVPPTARDKYLKGAGPHQRPLDAYGPRSGVTRNDTPETPSTEGQDDGQ